MTKGELWTVILLALTLAWQVFTNIRYWLQKSRKLSFIISYSTKDHRGRELVMFNVFNESRNKNINLVSIGIKKKDGNNLSKKVDIKMEPGQHFLSSFDNITQEQIKYFFAEDKMGNIYKSKFIKSISENN